jgi:hypothetical protein
MQWKKTSILSSTLSCWLRGGRLSYISLVLSCLNGSYTHDPLTINLNLSWAWKISRWNIWQCISHVLNNRIIGNEYNKKVFFGCSSIRLMFIYADTLTLIEKEEVKHEVEMSSNFFSTRRQIKWNNRFHKGAIAF